MQMQNYLGAEKAVHGRQWEALHGGYFSDPGIAEPLVETAGGILAKSPADMIVDLGGGTGFLLSQLAASHSVGSETQMVNVDCSDIQLALTGERGISPVCTSIRDLKRNNIAAKDKRLFFIMRSVLHYLRKDDLPPLLCHLRNQAKEHEFFVHQSASFNTEEAACLNALYRHMRTCKWYPTVSDLKKYLSASGWHVTGTVRAPSLLLTSDDLSQRYDLDAGDIKHIRKIMAKAFGEINSVFRLTPAGFEAKLEYQIYTCIAVPPGFSDIKQTEEQKTDHHPEAKDAWQERSPYK